MLVFARFTNRLIAMIAAAAIGFAAGPAWACQENAMLVFDASGSMSMLRDGERKIDTARGAAAEILPDVTRIRPTGLVTYGGQPGPTCGGVSLKMPPMQNSGGLILGELGLLEPTGQTPLSDAVWLAAQTLQSLNKPGIVVLVTDGLENCGRNACAIGRKIAAMSPAIRVHVIGFHLGGIGEERVSCLAKATGGTYASTSSLEGLRDALKKTLGCPRIS
ncbi:MAG: VWA domain-containing protein [Hyphomicrobiaceae bacterium]|nr:VWA domain-containing protein [Hyphomicrobiaceae bacterium]